MASKENPSKDNSQRSSNPGDGWKNQPTSGNVDKTKSISKVTASLQAGARTKVIESLPDAAVCIGPGAGALNSGVEAGSFNKIGKDAKIIIESVKPDASAKIRKGPGAGASNSGEKAGSFNEFNGELRM